MQHEAFAGVVREAHDMAGLVLEGMLRAVDIDPPKWHDVGQMLLAHAEDFPVGLQSDLAALADISRRLHRDLEAAFHGEIDLIPEPVLDRTGVQRALDDVRRVLDAIRHFDSGPA